MRAHHYWGSTWLFTSETDAPTKASLARLKYGACAIVASLRLRGLVPRRLHAWLLRLSLRCLRPPASSPLARRIWPPWPSAHALTEKSLAAHMHLHSQCCWTVGDCARSAVGVAPSSVRTLSETVGLRGALSELCRSVGPVGLSACRPLSASVGGS